MRRILLKSSIVIVGTIAAVVAWVAGARPLSLLLDRLHTVEIDSQPIAQLGIEDASGGMLRINDLPLSTAMPNCHPYPIALRTIWSGNSWCKAATTRSSSAGSTIR